MTFSDEAGDPRFESSPPPETVSEPASAEAFRLRILALLIPIYIGAIALALRLFRLNHFSYWLDEIMQVFFIHGSWKAFWDSLRFDAVHPPLDYLICRFLEFLSPTDPVRKIPAVVWGVGAVLTLGAFIRHRGGYATGYVSALGLCFAPFHVRYSQELRPYSLGIFLVLLSVLALECYLARPNIRRLAFLFLACVAAEYTLYLGAIVLGIACLSLLLEDSRSLDPLRRAAAFRFLRGSPLFCAAVAAAYFPWWPVLREASIRSSPTAPPSMSLHRLGTLLAFFSFSPNEGERLSWAGACYAALVVLGMVLALRQRNLRFLIGWFLGGAAIIEVLEHIHPHWYVPRHYLPAALVLPVFAAIPIVWLGRRNLLRIAASIGLFGLVLIADMRGLRAYYRGGRPDWRPLGAYLRATDPGERILCENQYVQLCVAFYVDGPAWLHETAHRRRTILTVQGDPELASAFWEPNRTAWLLLFNGGSQSRRLKDWAKPFSGIPFPSAEGGVVVKRLSH